MTQLYELELGSKGQTSTPGATSLLMTRPARSQGMRDWEIVGTPDETRSELELPVKCSVITAIKFPF